MTEKRYTEYAWNGISLEVPETWELLSIGRSTLELGIEGDAGGEFKWERIHGHFSFARHLKKIRRSFESYTQLDPKALQLSLPHSFRGTPFKWKFRGASGKGILLYKQSTQLACLALFSQNVSDSELRCIVSSMHDAYGAQSIPWKIFDLSCQTPAGFVLQEFSLRPGHYHLCLDNGVTQLQFHRFGPADVILRNNDLETWIRKNFPGAADLPRAHQTETMHIWNATPGRWRRFMNSARRLRSFKTLRAWRDSAANKLLVVEAASRRPLDKAMLETVCGAYEVIQK